MTHVIRIYGGTAVGKSMSAWLIAGKLEKAGENVFVSDGVLFTFDRDFEIKFAGVIASHPHDDASVSILVINDGQSRLTIDWGDIPPRMLFSALAPY